MTGRGVTTPKLAAKQKGRRRSVRLQSMATNEQPAPPIEKSANPQNAPINRGTAAGESNRDDAEALAVATNRAMLPVT